jgi:riboflavin synthase
MFTGLVEATAVVRHLRRGAHGARLGLAVRLERLALGESVSVAGACLTVAEVGPEGFEADMSAETLERTTLGALAPGERVNVERATRLGDRLGGHIVTGHVDGVGRVIGIERVGEARRLVVGAPGEVQRFLAPKGSVALDGVSLTVNGLRADGRPGEQGFDAMLVPHTLGHTTLDKLGVGQRVNLEADVLSRYVARQLELGGVTRDTGQSNDRALLEKLREGGFL